MIFIRAIDNLANINADRFLSLEILPKIQERYRDTTLALVGSKPVPQVREITVTDPVLSPFNGRIFASSYRLRHTDGYCFWDKK